MIRTAYDDGWLLISQPAHAWLSGQMAQQWGNDAVDPPQPYPAVMLGTTLHDAGWMMADSEPTLNQNGEPLNFIELTFEAGEPMYRRGVTHVMDIDPYAGILANRHVQNIQRSRATYGRDPVEVVQPMLDALEAQVQATVEQLRDHPTYGTFLSDNTLRHNYQILRTCDLLSLFLCGGISVRDIPEVSLRYGEPVQSVQCHWIDDETLRIEPYLFAEPRLTLTVTGRCLPQKTFTDVRELRAMYLTAEPVVLVRKMVQG